MSNCDIVTCNQIARELLDEKLIKRFVLIERGNHIIAITPGIPMSDVFAPTYGKESLRMALLALCFINLWCAVHYYLAGRTLKADLQSAASPAL